MISKFIVSINRFPDKRFSIHYLSTDFRNCLHRDIAVKFYIDPDDIVGGGLIDFNRRRIFGTSGEFGPYDPAHFADADPDLTHFTIDPPSDYTHD